MHFLSIPNPVPPLQISFVVSFAPGFSGSSLFNIASSLLRRSVCQDGCALLCAAKCELKSPHKLSTTRGGQVWRTTVERRCFPLASYYFPAATWEIQTNTYIESPCERPQPEYQKKDNKVEARLLTTNHSIRQILVIGLKVVWCGCGGVRGSDILRCTPQSLVLTGLGLLQRRAPRDHGSCLKSWFGGQVWRTTVERSCPQCLLNACSKVNARFQRTHINMESAITCLDLDTIRVVSSMLGYLGCFKRHPCEAANSFISQVLCEPLCTDLRDFDFP